ncbi:hypothetical protein [Methylomonas methanica]|uniref:Uncharacterized protein n=1 Tax=Methylomonas methanica (strain DSM 25384 / MC09) TaxID=857087 RepID=G0A2Q0_METMM|nr:hypothetical protein [Methylomonas methanica]AEG01403.1 hypothetical protein Metme_3025 [Methylomonas methanica MC09]
MNTAILVLLGMLAVSSAFGWWLSRRKVAEKPVRVMMFIGYFWSLTFLQLLLAALLYYIDQRFFPL